MSSNLFVCDQCDSVDDLDLAYKDRIQYVGPATLLCTCCQGKPWHNQFPKRKYDPQQDFVLNRATGVGLG